MRKVDILNGRLFVTARFKRDYTINYYRKITFTSLVRLTAVLDKMVNAGQMTIETDLVNEFVYYVEREDYSGTDWEQEYMDLLQSIGGTLPG